MCNDYTQLIADSEFWVLEGAGVIIGCVTLRDGPEALMVPNIAVMPGSRGNGYGRQLIDVTETQALQQGHVEIRLFVNALLLEIIAAYDQPRFVEIGGIRGDRIDRNYLYTAKSVTAAGIQRAIGCAKLIVGNALARATSRSSALQLSKHRDRNLDGPNIALTIRTRLIPLAESNAEPRRSFLKMTQPWVSAGIAMMSA